MELTKQEKKEQKKREKEEKKRLKAEGKTPMDPAKKKKIVKRSIIGAVAGVILGAKYGASQMPQAWIEKTRFPSGTCLTFTKGIDIRDYAEKITDIIVEG